MYPPATDLDLGTPLVTPHRNDQFSEANQPTRTLADLTKQMETLAQAYDGHFSDLSNTIGDVSDTALELNKNRTALACDAHDQFEAANEQRQRAERAYADNSAIDKLKRQLQHLEDQRQKLAEDQYDLTAEKEHLSLQHKRNQEQIAELSAKNTELERKANQDLPMVSSVRKILAGASSLTFHTNSDPDIVEGFISKNPQMDNDADVIPFRFDLREPRSTYVNRIWDIINQ